MKTKILNKLENLATYDLVEVYNLAALFSEKLSIRYYSLSDLLNSEPDFELIDLLDNSLPLLPSDFFIVDGDKIKGVNGGLSNNELDLLASELVNLYSDSKFMKACGENLADIYGE